MAHTNRLESTLLALLGALLTATASAEEPVTQLARAQVAKPDVAEASEPRAPETSDRQERAAQESHVAPQTPPPIVYVPPRRGAPRDRVGGGMRGSQALPQPLALAPDHVALTVRESPILFWHVDGRPPQGARMVFTLMEASGVEPVAEIPLSRPSGPGIQRIDLAEKGIRLEREKEYEWSIALVQDPERRARDVVSVAYITRVEVPRVSGGDAAAGTYAELGLWYDALQALAEEIAANPEDAHLRAQRDALLRQADLDAAID